MNSKSCSVEVTTKNIPGLSDSKGNNIKKMFISDHNINIDDIKIIHRYDIISNLNSDKIKKTVYVGLSADILHEGHINILKIAKNYGDVTVGLLTDAAISTYKKMPIMAFEDRKSVIAGIKYVSEVVPQETHDYTENLRKLKSRLLAKIGIGMP